MRKLSLEVLMKNGLLIGLAAGVITATVLYQKAQEAKNPAKRSGKSAIIKKIEDMLE